MQTIRQVLLEARQQLEKLPDIAARLEAEILLAFALHKPRAYLHAWPEQALDPSQLEHYKIIIRRRCQGEPVAYITGVREFWGLPLQVSTATLIPRPETERLVEIALQLLPDNISCEIADLGTGSGAVALAIASERPSCSIHATDINPQTLAIAQHNQQTLQLSNIHFYQGSWFAPLANLHFDLVVSNPPYVADKDPHLQQGDLRFEPLQALSSGPDGLADIRKIIKESPSYLKPGGWLLLEHGYNHGDEVTALMRNSGFVQVSCIRDYGKRERASLGQLVAI